MENGPVRPKVWSSLCRTTVHQGWKKKGRLRARAPLERFSFIAPRIATAHSGQRGGYGYGMLWRFIETYGSETWFGAAIYSTQCMSTSWYLVDLYFNIFQHHFGSQVVSWRICTIMIHHVSMYYQYGINQLHMDSRLLTQLADLAPLSPVKTGLGMTFGIFWGQPT